MTVALWYVFSGHRANHAKEMCLGIRALTNWAVLHGLLSPLCGMLRRAATGIGASKTAIWPVLALGGERTHANQGYLCGKSLYLL